MVGLVSKLDKKFSFLIKKNPVWSCFFDRMLDGLTIWIRNWRFCTLYVSIFHDKNLNVYRVDGLFIMIRNVYLEYVTICEIDIRYFRFDEI
jgi:hypothetical protein